MSALGAQERTSNFLFNAVLLDINRPFRTIDMTNLDDRQPPAVGAYWINEEDYPAVLKIFPDGNKMPRTWREWLKMAEEMERGL